MPGSSSVCSQQGCFFPRFRSPSLWVSGLLPVLKFDLNLRAVAKADLMMRIIITAWKRNSGSLRDNGTEAECWGGMKKLLPLREVLKLNEREVCQSIMVIKQKILIVLMVIVLLEQNFNFFQRFRVSFGNYLHVFSAHYGSYT